MRFTLEFKSPLQASKAEAWKWITSLQGISAELRPLLRMSAPAGVHCLNDLKIELGKPLFRSRIYLFGVLPVDYSGLTLLEFKEGVGFTEQSPMGSMRHWRHARQIEGADHGCTVTDVLTFEPRYASSVSKWAVKRLFTHRHVVLRRSLGSA